MKKRDQIQGTFSSEDCDIWLAAMGWVRDRERWYSPEGIEILSYTLSDEEMAKHPCVIRGGTDATESMG